MHSFNSNSHTPYELFFIKFQRSPHALSILITTSAPYSLLNFTVHTSFSSQMGSFISSFHSSNHQFAGKIILPDGSFKDIISQQVAAAELMLENPGSYVVEYSSNSTAKLFPLPADYRLDPTKVYLMIPLARCKTNGVSIEEARKVMSLARSTSFKSKKISAFGMCMLGVDVREREMMGEFREAEVEEEEKTVISMDEFDEKAESLRRQYSSKGWKPSLGTIEERKFEKEPHWLF